MQPNQFQVRCLDDRGVICFCDTRVSNSAVRNFISKLSRATYHVIERICARKMIYFDYRITWIKQIIVNSQKLVKRRLLVEGFLG